MEQCRNIDTLDLKREHVKVKIKTKEKILE